MKVLWYDERYKQLNCYLLLANCSALTVFLIIFSLYLVLFLNREVFFSWFSNFSYVCIIQILHMFDDSRNFFYFTFTINFTCRLVIVYSFMFQKEKEVALIDSPVFISKHLTNYFGFIRIKVIFTHGSPVSIVIYFKPSSRHITGCVH